ncbi:MAG: type IV secretion protein IcmC [Gammaproteobacteria bacterium]|nr:type IV secretion protein IcmC [Gammaproteobacteria bacterium]
MTDLTTMFINLSRSLVSVITGLKGVSYLLGLLFFYLALDKLRAMSAQGQGGHHQMTIPLLYGLSGAAMLFLPQTITVLTNSTFGSSSILSYGTPNQPITVLDATVVLLKMVGFIWFIRGCVLIAHASNPGVKDGPKGAAFACGGLLAINLDYCIALVRGAFTSLQALLGGAPSP